MYGLLAPCAPSNLEGVVVIAEADVEQAVLLDGRWISAWRINAVHEEEGVFWTFQKVVRRA